MLSFIAHVTLRFEKPDSPYVCESRIGVNLPFYPQILFSSGNILNYKNIFRKIANIYKDFYLQNHPI